MTWARGARHGSAQRASSLRALQIERVLSRKIIDYWGSEANVIGTQISAMHRR